MELDLVFLTILFFAVLCLGTMIAVAKRKLLLFVFIPLTLVVTASVIHTYTDLLGKPTSKTMPEQFFVVSHIIAEEEKLIYLWIVHKGEDVPISYEIPHSTDVQEQLEGLQRRQQELGAAVVIKGFKPRDNENVEFQLYYFIDQPHLQKEEESSQ